MHAFLLNETVVLDTGTPIVHIGVLREVTDAAFVLSDADMHDCRDGHAHKEHYLAGNRSVPDGTQNGRGAGGAVGENGLAEVVENGALLHPQG